MGGEGRRNSCTRHIPTGSEMHTDCLSYEHARHFLVPVKNRFTKIFKEERRHPDECWEQDLSSMRDELFFLEACWH